MYACDGAPLVPGAVRAEDIAQVLRTFAGDVGDKGEVGCAAHHCVLGVDRKLCSKLKLPGHP
eukprot:SAG31_NODE_32955_length_349_cov_1.664000_1_plen_61_part_10